MGCNRCGYEGRVALSTCSGYRLVRTPVTYNDPEQSTRVTLNRYLRVTNPVLDILGCVTKRPPPYRMCPVKCVSLLVQSQTLLLPNLPSALAARL